MHYEGRLQQLGLRTLEERRNWADLIEVFKIAHAVSRKYHYQTYFDLTHLERFGDIP